MSHRIFHVAALTATIFASASAWAANDSEESTHDGKFVSATRDQLTMKDKNGKEHSHTLAAEAPVMCDGAPCKAMELKPGMKIRVTTKGDDKKIATSVEAIDKHAFFSNTHEGKLVSLTNRKLTMTDAKGEEHSRMVAKDATITCDTKTCTTEHVKSGMRIRVTTMPGDSDLVTHIEAIEKDAEFSTTSDKTASTNTGVNARDRGTKAKTPFDQNEKKADIKTTADIRKRVVAEKMSSNAHNVKIITQDGKVTLRGPVKTEDEKKKIDEIAIDVAGAKNVDNQLEVEKK